MSNDTEERASEELVPEDQSKRLRPVQFSLRTIMLVVLFVCILCIPGGPWMIEVVYTSCVPAILGIAIWKGRGWVRAFAICAFVPHLSLIFDMFERADSLQSAFRGALAGIAGATCHSYLERREGIAPVPNLPFIRNWFSN